MEYLFKIEDEQQLNRLASAIARVAAKQAAFEVMEENGLIKKFYNMTECYKISSRGKVDTAVKKGKLSVVFKGKNTLISRDEFRNWLNKDDLL